MSENEYAVVSSNQQLQPLENRDFQMRLIVPDALLSSYTPSVTVMNILCKGEESAKQLDIALNQYLEENRKWKCHGKCLCAGSWLLEGRYISD